MRIFILVITFNLLFNNSIAQCSTEEIRSMSKTALVIGERNYNSKLGTLNNTLSDAKGIADSLRNLRFEVEDYYDLDLISMKRIIDNWLERTKSHEVALFYFSGHGAELSGTNYLFPIDAVPANEYELAGQTIAANQIITELTDNVSLKYAVVILDACRNNPLKKGWKRSNSDGLAAMAGGKNIYIAYAAETGKTASDGNGKSTNSPYTAAILKYISIPNQTIDQLFTKVNKEVEKATKKDQTPYRTTSFSSDFCFNVLQTDKGIDDDFVVSSCSNMIVTKKSDEVFIADSSKLLYKKLRGNKFEVLLPDSLSPFILIGGKHLVYALDSVHRTISIIDKTTKELISKKILKYIPKSFSVSRDETRIYASFFDSTSNGIIMYDLERGTINYTNVNYQIGSVCISKDGKSIFAFISKESANYLYRYDAKNLRILDSFKTFSILENLSLNNAGDLLFVSNQFNAKRNILIFDTKSLKIRDTIFLEANSFLFTPDSNYCVVSNKSINFINLKDKTVNNIAVNNIPMGLALLDYEIYAFLPGQAILYFKNIKKILQSPESSNMKPEDIFAKAIERNKMLAAKEKAMQKKEVTFSGEAAFFDVQAKYEIGEIINKLGATYAKKYDLIAIDTLSSTFVVDIGIIGSKNNSVLGTITWEMVGQKAFLKITDENMKTDTSEYSLVDENNFQLIRDIIHNFFFKRADKF